VVRCGAHLSNLALGVSKVALRLFRTKVVQEAFESEVVSAHKWVKGLDGWRGVNSLIKFSIKIS
jgi:hypothetical protein